MSAIMVYNPGNLRTHISEKIARLNSRMPRAWKAVTSTRGRTRLQSIRSRNMIERFGDVSVQVDWVRLRDGEAVAHHRTPRGTLCSYCSRLLISSTV